MPAPAELVAGGARFALDALADDVLVHAHRPQQLTTEGIRWTTKIVLFPARFCVHRGHRQEWTNDAAAEHYLARGLPGAALVDRRPPAR